MDDIHLAAVAHGQPLVRIGGGSETDVYCTPDRRHVLKVKEAGHISLAEGLRQVQELRNTANQIVKYLGPTHTLPTDFLLAQAQTGQLRIVARQTYLDQALPLAEVPYETLSREAQIALERQLLTLLRRSLRSYRRTGHMPDLYGTYSRSRAERLRINTPLQWPRRLARFFTQRLWHAHNLLLDRERIVLVDYDHVRWRGWWGQLYYVICWLLYARDYLHLAWRQQSWRHNSSRSVAGH
jgi:hypothetical protein